MSIAFLYYFDSIFLCFIYLFDFFVQMIFNFASIIINFRLVFNLLIVNYFCVLFANCEFFRQKNIIIF
nr:MAG TPA: hypothetical protein [Caudoviricetes sp.]